MDFGVKIQASHRIFFAHSLHVRAYATGRFNIGES